MTRAMRETREEAEMYKYDKVYYFKTQGIYNLLFSNT